MHYYSFLSVTPIFYTHPMNTTDTLIPFSVMQLLRVAAAVPEVSLANPVVNMTVMADMCRHLSARHVRLTVFPELSLTGYTCADLFGQSLLLDKVEDILSRYLGNDAVTETESSLLLPEDMVTVIGAPLRRGPHLYNCAVVIAGNRILGVVPKSHIPNYSEFYELRWFTPAADITASTISIRGHEVPFGTDLLFDIGGAMLGVEICEDLWVPTPPSSRLCRQGADIIANLSASDENIGKHDYLLQLITQQSARCSSGYVYASAGVGESSTDLVFSGNAIIAADGTLLETSSRFIPSSFTSIADIDIERLRNDRRHRNTFDSTREPEARVIRSSQSVSDLKEYFSPLQPVDPTPFVPSDAGSRSERCREILSIQAWGLMQRLRATGMKKVVIGISGGLDSTLALLVAVKAFEMLGIERSNIVGITMPGFGTTDRTHSNAWRLMQELGVTPIEIPIGEAVQQHFAAIGHDGVTLDATYENSQARERTQILMDYANRIGGLVVGTGDLSELALGWCTYNADQMSMYGVNASVPKTLVRHLIEWYADCEATPEVARLLRDIADTPISPELLPAKDNGEIDQKTEDLVGPYLLHDFFLYHVLRNGFRPLKIYMLACNAFEGVYDTSVIRHWMRNFYRRFFSQQFKRSVMPDGPKVGSVCLSPRGDWRMPSDASSRMWLDEVDNLEHLLSKDCI